MPGRRILITGLSHPLAAGLATRLEEDERVERLVGLDLTEPEQPLSRTEFIRADLRSPFAAKAVESTRVDTLVHLALRAAPADVGGRARMKELNVIGTMQLLAAAQRTPAVERVVIRSTTAVYGSHYADPALWREDAEISDRDRHGYGKDALEVERYAREFARRRSDATVTVLRLANIIGPNAQSPLTRYLALPVVPTVLGYDPRLQLCHELDALEVLHRSVVEEHPGTYNVAGPGVIYLSQAVHMAGKAFVPVPRPLASVAADLVRRTGRVDFSVDQLPLLLYGRVGDIGRLRRVFGYEPQFGTRAGFEDFLAAGRITPLADQAVVRQAERWLRRLRAAGRSVGAPDHPPPVR